MLVSIIYIYIIYIYIHIHIHTHIYICMYIFSISSFSNKFRTLLRKAQHMMLDLTWSHGRLLEQLLEMGCLRMRPQAASVFAVEVQSLQQQLLEIRGLLKSSWWECFDLGAAGQSRLMLLQMCHNLDFLIGWLESMVMAVQHAKLSNPAYEPGFLLRNSDYKKGSIVNNMVSLSW